MINELKFNQSKIKILLNFPTGTIPKFTFLCMFSLELFGCHKSIFGNNYYKINKNKYSTLGGVNFCIALCKFR